MTKTIVDRIMGINCKKNYGMSIIKDIVSVNKREKNRQSLQRLQRVSYYEINYKSKLWPVLRREKEEMVSRQRQRQRGIVGDVDLAAKFGGLIFPLI